MQLSAAPQRTMDMGTVIIITPIELKKTKFRYFY